MITSSRNKSHSPRPFSLLLLSLTLILALVTPALGLSKSAPPPASYRTLSSSTSLAHARRWRTELTPSGQRRALTGEEEEDYDCRPYGNCEACPKDQRSEPFCQPYGNRRLLHCVPKGHTHHSDHAHSVDGEIVGGETNPAFSTHEKEIPAWEACGKVISKEREDYWEFVTTNMLFFIVSMVVLLLRTRKLAGMQYRMLAARIGLPGSGGGAGSGGGRFLGFSI